MEIKIVYFFNQLGKDTFFENITEFFSSVGFLAVFSALLLLIPFLLNRKTGLKILGAVAFAFLLQFVVLEILLREIIPFRERPYIAFPEDINAIGRKLSNSSLPSSHMSASLVFLTVYFYHYKKYWPILFLAAISMAFIRMHMGMHYPSDILVGSLLGIVFGAIGIFVIEIVEKKLLVLYNNKVKKRASD